MRRLFLLAALLAILAPPARAHADFALADGPLTLDPGETATWTFENHYHRIVGHVRAPAGASLVVAVEGAGNVAGPGHSLSVNALLACCRDVFSTRRAVTIENVGEREATIDLRLVALHDGIAVTNDGAEPGAIEFTVGFAALVSATAWRARRRDLRADHRAARRAWFAFAALWLAAAIPAGWGMLQYGGGPVAGTVAATADLPSTGHLYLTTHAVLLLGFMAFWAWTVHLWTRVRGGDAKPLALALAASTLVVTGAWAIEYGTWLAPGLTLVAAAAAPAIAVTLTRLPPR